MSELSKLLIPIGITVIASCFGYLYYHLSLQEKQITALAVSVKNAENNTEVYDIRYLQGMINGRLTNLERLVYRNQDINGNDLLCHSEH